MDSYNNHVALGIIILMGICAIILVLIDKPKPVSIWRHGPTHIAYPFATGTTILDEWSHRQRVVAIGGCNDPIPQLNLRAFEGE